MAQHDYVIANQGFPAFRSDLNDALAAIVSNNSGATEPTTMFAHQMWVDTAADPSVLKIRNADNDAWITIGSIDQTGDTFTLVNLRTSGPVVFNDAGADVDFRVEGDTDANLLFVDAGNNRVGIGTGTPAATLDVNGVLDANGILIGTNGDSIQTSGGNFFFQTTSAHDLIFRTNSAERMRITSAGEVLVGGTTSVTAIPGAVSVQRTDNQPIYNLYRNDTSIVSGNSFGEINWWGNDTTSNTPKVHAYISANASGTHAAGDNPTDLVFGVTQDGTETVFEALRITQNGTLDSQDTYDNTQSGSTVVVTSGGLIGRTSSSIKYKKDVETLDADLVSNAIANLRPVWYRTKDAKGDDKETWSHIGLIAEEVHEVEPRLVRYRTEKVEFVDVEEEVTKTREVSPAVTDEEGNVVQEAVTEEYTETVTRKEKQKTPLETPEPEDVDYGRLAVLCLAKIQEQDKTIAALEARIAALENA